MTDNNSVFQYPHARLLIFAKAPIAGQVKSRLIPDIGATAAAELHRLLTLNIVSLAIDSALCPVELWCVDESHHFFQSLSQRFAVKLYTQQGNDLGERMYHAGQSALKHANNVIIVGSDCLQFTSDHLKTALDKLSTRQIDAVITPALDGGYVLLGMNKIDQRLFDDIPWGTAEVLAQTRAALQALQWRWNELPPLRDIDVKEDLMDLLSNRHQYRPDAGIDALLRQLDWHSLP